jgi:hypothetical protein
MRTDKKYFWFTLLYVGATVLWTFGVLISPAPTTDRSSEFFFLTASLGLFIAAAIIGCWNWRNPQSWHPGLVFLLVLSLQFALALWLSWDYLAHILIGKPLPQYR